MDGQEARQWGITRAISNAQPTEADLKLNDALVEALKRENNFETAEGTEKRWVARFRDPIRSIADELQKESPRTLAEGH